MGGNDVGHIGDAANRVFKAEKTVAAGVGFITLHDTGPLVTAHGRGTAVGEQVNQHITGLDAEGIEMGGRENGGSFRFSGKVDGFNGFNPERFNDGFHVKGTVWHGHDWKIWYRSGKFRLFGPADDIFPEVHEGYKCRAGKAGEG